MGVRGFLSYVKKKVSIINPINYTEPQKIGIDVHGLLYIWQEDMSAIEAFLEAFSAAGHTMIFVFDGEAPAEKKDILQKRKLLRENSALQAHALQQFLDSEEGKRIDEKSRYHLEKQILSLKASTWSITKEYREKVIERIRQKNGGLLFAKGEADEELVRLEKEKQINVILSSDMDFIRFGVARMWIPRFRKDCFECYDFELSIFCHDEDINIENLKDIATLCGSEYEYSRISPSEALGLIRYYGCIENIRRLHPQLLGV